MVTSEAYVDMTVIQRVEHLTELVQSGRCKESYILYASSRFQSPMVYELML
jgi:hypothetical protein